MKTIRIGALELFGLKFDQHAEPFFENYSDPWYHLNPGSEHYRLLSYLSTQFNDCNILDVGTDRGHSALSLCYNKSNTIHSFDIMNRVTNEKIRTNSNARFYLEDLWNPSVFETFVPLIKSSPLIFLDVSPHDGLMEMAFYQKLKEIGYEGILICDDIHHFEGMRNFFWSKIPASEKYDVSRYGHWSGTGIICFNKTTQFEIV